MYKHTVTSGKHSHALNVRLPLHNFDFSLNNEQSKKALLDFIEETTVIYLKEIFRANAKSVFECYKKDATIGSQKTLRGLVEAVYRRLVTCSTNLDSAKFTPDQLLELNSFLQRFRAKIEYACAMAFYAWSDKFYIGLNENAAPFISDIPADLENLLKTADGRSLVFITKKRIKLLYVSNAHCPLSSALYSSTLLHKQASSLTLCALLAAHICSTEAQCPPS
ncbi:hypothetical protein TYRP_022004 [Tyrophagus putrescentiae]|nr:hypothetical protein TYRP_022004 [Tyrophagus putrescentiae]